MTVVLAMNNEAHWSSGVDATAGRFDTELPYSLIVTDNALHGMNYLLPDFPGGVTECWLQWDHYASGGGNASDDGYWARFYDTNGAEFARLDAANGNFFVTVYGTTTVSTPQVFKASGNVPMRINFRWGANLECDFYYNDVLVGSASTTNNGKTAPSRLHWDMIDASSVTDRLSNMIVSTVDLQNYGMNMQVPNAVGTDTGFSGALSSVTDGNVNTGLSSDNVVGTKHSFTKPNITTTKSIYGYTPNAQVYCSNTPVNVRMYLRIGGTQYNGDTITLRTNSQNYVSHTWTVDPSDSNPWTDAKINAAEFGIEIVA